MQERIDRLREAAFTILQRTLRLGVATASSAPSTAASASASSSSDSKVQAVAAPLPALPHVPHRSELLEFLPTYVLAAASLSAAPLFGSHSALPVCGCPFIY
jgi:hypothetical protein